MTTPSSCELMRGTAAAGLRQSSLARDRPRWGEGRCISQKHNLPFLPRCARRNSKNRPSSDLKHTVVGKKSRGRPRNACHGGRSDQNLKRGGGDGMQAGERRRRRGRDKRAPPQPPDRPLRTVTAVTRTRALMKCRRSSEFNRVGLEYTPQSQMGCIGVIMMKR